MTPCRILMVEDEAVVAMDLEERLAGMGYTVTGHAVDGEEALTMAGERRPDLVLMDIRLQGDMDGITAAAEIRHRFQLPVLFLTAYSEEETLERAKRAEPYGYLLKPFNDSDLKSSIEMGLHKHRTEQQLRRMNRLYDTLSHANQAIVRTQTREALLAAVCRVIVEHGGIDLAWIGWIDQDTSRIKPAAHYGKEGGLLCQVDHACVEQAMGWAELHRTLLEGQPLMYRFPESEDGARPSSQEQAPGQGRYRFCAVFPIPSNGRVSGMLNLWTEDFDLFGEEETALFKDLALDLSFALERLEAEVQRRRAEEALRESERKLRASGDFLEKILNSINDPIYVKDEEHRFVLVNEALCRMVGCGTEELLGKTDLDFFPPGQAEAFAAQDNEVLATGKDYVNEEVITDTAGRYRTVITRKSRSTDPRGHKYVVGVSHDITDRKQAAESIFERDRRMRTLLENLPGVVYRCANDPHWTMEFLSEGCETLTGYSPADLIGNRRLSYSELVYPDDRQRLWDGWQEVIAERGAFQGEYRITCASGEVKWVWESGSPIFDESGRLLALEGFVMDISYRRQAEELLKKSEARYRSVVEDAPMMICTYLPDTTLLFVNDAACRYFQRPREELIGRRFLPRLPGFEWERVQTLLAGLTPERPAIVWENEFVERDGSSRCHRWTSRAMFDDSGKAVLFQGFGEDITDQKSSQADLQRLATAIDQAGETVVITNAKGDIEYVNPAFERTTGYSREEALGRNPRILKSGRQNKGFYEDLWQTLLAGKVWFGRFTNRRKDGTLFEEEAVISPVFDPHGHITQFVAVKRDVTREVELEERLRQLHKMEAVGQLAGGVAHDFNNMLSPIMGYAELLLDDLHPADDRYDQVMQIKKAAERSRDLTRQLLAFSRKQILQVRPFVLSQITENMEKLLRRTLREDIAMQIVPDAPPCIVMADVGQVEQILMNLVVNAQDAMPAGGLLTIEVSRAELTEQDCQQHPDTVPGRYGVLSVSDTGSGMDRETLEHIFEPFYSTKGEKGTGLGLATVYGVVKQHHGHIMVASELGRGTAFHIFLPEAEEAVLGAGTGKPVSASLTGDETILLVEDDEMVLRMASTVLTRQGYHVMPAASGAEALALLERHSGPVHLLLSDVVMPGMNGRELYEALARRVPGLRVLFMSGYTDDVIARHGLLEEGTSLIQKPFTVRDLPAKVREVLDKEA